MKTDFKVNYIIHEIKSNDLIVILTQEGKKVAIFLPAVMMVTKLEGGYSVPKLSLNPSFSRGGPSTSNQRVNSEITFTFNTGLELTVVFEIKEEYNAFLRHLGDAIPHLI